MLSQFFLHIYLGFKLRDFFAERFYSFLFLFCFPLLHCLGHNVFICFLFFGHTAHDSVLLMAEEVALSLNFVFIIIVVWQINHVDLNFILDILLGSCIRE